MFNRHIDTCEDQTYTEAAGKSFARDPAVNVVPLDSTPVIRMSAEFATSISGCAETFSMGIKERGLVVDTSESERFLGKYKYSSTLSKTVAARQVGRGESLMGFDSSSGEFTAASSNADDNLFDETVEFTIKISNSVSPGSKVNYKS